MLNKPNTENEKEKKLYNVKDMSKRNQLKLFRQYKLTTIGTDKKEPCQNLELNMKEKVNLSANWIQVAIRIE